MMKTNLISVALLIAASAIPVTATAADVNAKQTHAKLLNSYKSAGLSTDDYVFDMALGTRLAGIKYCGIGDVNSIDALAVSKKRLDHLNQTIPTDTSMMSQALTFAMSMGDQMYGLSTKEIACSRKQTKLFTLNYENFKNGNADKYAGMKKIFAPESAKVKGKKKNTDLLFSGLSRF